MVQFGSHAATHAHTLVHPHPLCYAHTHVHPGRHYSHTLTCAHAHALHSPRRSQVCISYVCSFLSAFLPAKKPQPMSRSTDLPPAISITPTTCAHTHTHTRTYSLSHAHYFVTHTSTHTHTHTHKLTHAHSHHHSHTKLHSHK